LNKASHSLTEEGVMSLFVPDKGNSSLGLFRLIAKPPNIALQPTG
jgi:hypothetical protein